MASMVTDESFASFRSRRGSGAGVQEPIAVLTIPRQENLDRFPRNPQFHKHKTIAIPQNLATVAGQWDLLWAAARRDPNAKLTIPRSGKRNYSKIDSKCSS
ncbi:hypothetical protein GCM10023156_17520 [Novipirellula rosea]|uniref:Uncharacterized protein n=1 Tax=Novipirellula rosea TaxID=1031540 RepID=A0ABP8MJ50_9BACT